MKLYYPKSLLFQNSKSRSALFPLLKVFLKSDGFVPDPASTTFNIPDQEMQLVDQIEDADILILPMSWDYYVNEGKVNVAQEFILNMAETHKPVVIFMSGDFGVKMKDFKNVTVFRYSGYQNKLPKSHVGLPAFIRDPLERYYNSETVMLKDYDAMPTVGFCGQASDSFSNRLKESAKVMVRNMRYYLRLSTLSPQTIESTSYNRYKLIKLVQKSRKLKSNFLIRSQYGAGIKHGRGATKVAEEYFENTNTSDYILCYRGAGNFSVRFYETLAMGRIPVYINTDGFLPLANQVDWNNHVVWIERSEIKSLTSKISDFHNALGKDGFLEIQKRNRDLWKNELNLWSFFYKAFQNIQK
ncbi:hypothetical protein AB9K26_06055 [Psychroserpens sp. XS_ASV72]|uniref:hypothetical protein n=1 Tax=Psychroserpens sp. XS_ASV72 TaxID=3241293 RepID=UPI0035173072